MDQDFLPQGVDVCFAVTPIDPQGNTVMLEVELHRLPSSFSGKANYISGFVPSGARATATATGLFPGEYGWAYRVVNNQGLASDWVAASNPNFTIPTLIRAPDNDNFANRIMLQGKFMGRV